MTATPTITPTRMFEKAPLNGTYAYPQPAADYVRFVYSSTGAGTAEAFVYNLAGMLVAKEKGLMAVSDRNYIEIKTVKFAPGAYFYIIKTAASDGAAWNYPARKFMVR